MKNTLLLFGLAAGALFVAGCSTESTLCARKDFTATSFTTDELPYSAIHLQGMAGDESGVYWAFGDGITKTDWEGHVLAAGRTCFPSGGHIGDICLHNGKVYATSWRNALKSEKIKQPHMGVIQVFDAQTMQALTNENVTVPFGIDGITFADGNFIIGAREDVFRVFIPSTPYTNCSTTVYSEDFQSVRRRCFTSTGGQGIKGSFQTAASTEDGIWLGCYSYDTKKKDNRPLILVDRELNFIQNFPVDAAMGIVPVPAAYANGEKRFLIGGQGMKKNPETGKWYKPGTATLWRYRDGKFERVPRNEVRPAPEKTGK